MDKNAHLLDTSARKAHATEFKVLVIDDDEATRIAFSQILRGAGYAVVEAADGQKGLEVCAREQPSLIVLDVEMPKLSGWQVLAELRSRKWMQPILMLTGLSQIENKVRGLGSGADDYLPKPCDARELLARVNALLRRTQSSKSEVDLLVFGETTVSLKNRKASRNGQAVELTHTQYALLELFARAPGQLITRQKLLEEAMGYVGQTNTRAVDTHIWRLRQKLNDEGREVQWIQNVLAGDGYRMISDPMI